MSEKGTCDNPERPWTYVCKCLRIATKGTKVGSTATVQGTVYLAYPILPFGIVKCTFFQTTFFQQLLTEHNENTIAAINHQRARQIKFRDNSRIFIPWVSEVFLACGGNFRCWPKANTSSAVGRSHERRSREKNLWPLRAGHYKDLTETGNRARKVSGTQGRIFIFR